MLASLLAGNLRFCTNETNQAQRAHTTAEE